MKRCLTLLLVVLSACQFNGLNSAPLPTPYPPEYISTVIAMTSASSAPPATLAAATPTQPSPTPSITPTLAHYEQYTIDYLRRRTYGEGTLEIVDTLEVTEQLTRVLIRYTSDTLTIYGFMSIPAGDDPLPVIIIIHGLGDSGTFNSLKFRSEMADALAREGFLVIFPILRGYLPSDNGDNMFRVGMAIDILNLIAHIRSQGGQPGPLEKAHLNGIGLLGQSMGGNVALRVLTVSADVKAAVLYSSLSGNELENSEQLYRISLEPQFQNEMNTLPSLMPSISPVYHYRNITAPIQLYHGSEDDTVPIGWARENCSYLTTAGVNINCIYYEGEGHRFGPAVEDEFLASLFDFFGQHLSP